MILKLIYKNLLEVCTAHSESYLNVSNYDYQHDYPTATNLAISKEANKLPEARGPQPQNGNTKTFIRGALLTEMLNAKHVYPVYLGIL